MNELLKDARDALTELRAEHDTVEYASERPKLVYDLLARCDAVTARLTAALSSVEAKPVARLIELADELDGELDSGAKWTNAQHTCASVSGALRDLAVALAAPLASVEAQSRLSEAQAMAHRLSEFAAQVESEKSGSIYVRLTVAEARKAAQLLAAHADGSANHG